MLGDFKINILQKYALHDILYKQNSLMFDLLRQAKEEQLLKGLIKILTIEYRKQIGIFVLNSETGFKDTLCTL